MPSGTIEGSRTASVLLLLVSLALSLSCALMLRGGDADWRPWAGAILFGLGDVVFVTLLVRPHRLVLDDQALTVSGGLIPRPHVIPWRDVDRFLVARGVRNSTLIGFNWHPDSGRRVGLGGRLGIDGALPKYWRGYSTGQLVEHLNACRDAVAARGRASPFGRRIP